MSIRKTVFMNGGYYHIFNRGVDRRVTFGNQREFWRAMELLYFYQFNETPLRFSHYDRLYDSRRQEIDLIMRASRKKVCIVSYTLMSNHFHLTLKQNTEGGISQFISLFENAYTKYFNRLHKRSGVLFQNVFKDVYVESNDQLLHLTRYQHLNPITASIIALDKLSQYPWSSYNAYTTGIPDMLIDSQEMYMILQQVPNYKNFIWDNADYTKELHRIRHLTLDN